MSNQIDLHLTFTHTLRHGLQRDATWAPRVEGDGGAPLDTFPEALGHTRRYRSLTVQPVEDVIEAGLLEWRLATSIALGEVGSSADAYLTTQGRLSEASGDAARDPNRPSGAAAMGPTLLMFVAPTYDLAIVAIPRG